MYKQCITSVSLLMYKQCAGSSRSGNNYVQSVLLNRKYLFQHRGSLEGQLKDTIYDIW
jgi:hypothetical protein